jgi:hypothetical protein
MDDINSIAFDAIENQIAAEGTAANSILFLARHEGECCRHFTDSPRRLLQRFDEFEGAPGIVAGNVIADGDQSDSGFIGKDDPHLA